MLQINNIQKSYTYAKNKKEEVLKGLNCEFIHGGINIILGPSGCGKSTLLNIISGLDTDYNGEVLFQGQNLKTLNLDSYRNQAIGFVFQNFNLIPHLTLLENVKVPLNLNRESNSKNSNRALEVLDMLGMKEYAHKKPNELSGGQKQRVAIARALVSDPMIIIADEPTGSLDSKTSEEIKRIFVELSQKFNKTIIIVTHDNSFKELSDRTIQMQDGLIKTIEDKTQNDSSNINSNDEILKFNKNHYGPIKTIKNAFINLSTRKLRTSLVSFATSIGIIGILIALSLGTGVNQSIDKLFSTVINPNSVNMSPKVQSGMPIDFIPKSIVKDIEDELKNKGINKIDYTSYALITVMEVREKILNKKSNDGNIIQGFPGRYTIQQILKGNESKYDSQTLEVGNPMSNGERGIYIQPEIAKILLDNDEPSKDDYNSLIGTKITLRYEKIVDSEKRSEEISSTIKGVLKPSGFQTLSVLDYDTYDELMNKLGIKDYIVSVSGITDSPESAEEIAISLRKNIDLNEKYSITTQKDLIGAITQVFSIITVILVAVAGLALLVSAFMILIVLFTSVVERTREIGVLRALGYKKRDIRNIFIGEAFAMVAIANIIAIIIVYLLQSIINYFTLKQFQFNAVVITLENIIFVTLVTLLVALIASILPAIRASKLDPAESLRYE